LLGLNCTRFVGAVNGSESSISAHRNGGGPSNGAPKSARDDALPVPQNVQARDRGGCGALAWSFGSPTSLPGTPFDNGSCLSHMACSQQVSERVSSGGDHWSQTNDRYPDHVELLSAGEGVGSTHSAIR
jgi:hypothetical protein